MKFIPILIAVILMLGCGAETKEDSSDQGVVEEAQALSKHTEIYDNGQIKIDGWMRGDKREGLWVSYYENGVKWSEDEYRAGMKDGKSVTYFPNGLLRYRGHYIEDTKAGTWQFYDETGKLVKEEDFNK
jgi:antitoxin component YwqK of YwqJK toxin-antitoxin module